MAEVLDHWPQGRTMNAATFQYPWEIWATLDENGHGDIWLATAGIDFPAIHDASRFRATLYNRAQRVTKIREKNAPLVNKRVRIRQTGQVTVRPVRDFKVLRVTVKVVADNPVAFQFFDSPEPPPAPQAASPQVSRRKTIHKHVTRRQLVRA